MNEELEKISFFRNHVMIMPDAAMLNDLGDSDVYKLESLNKLLVCMHDFADTLGKLGVKLSSEPGKSSFFDICNDNYDKGHSTAKLFMRSNWFDPKYPMAIHAGFSFHMYVGQDIHPEISDWIKISISHFNTVPFSLASFRQHGMYLTPTLYRGKRFLKGIDLGKADGIDFSKEGDMMSFKTDRFKKAVEDACKVMEAIAIDHEFLIP